MIKCLLIVIAVLCLYSQDDFEKFKKQQSQDFKEFTDKQQDELDRDTREWNQFLQEIQAIWGDQTVSTNKDWVRYSPDKKTRTIMDFENNTMIVQVMGSSSKKDAVNEIEKLLSNLEKEKETVKESSSTIVKDNIGFNPSEKVNDLEIKQDKKIVEAVDQNFYEVKIPFKEGAKQQRALLYVPLAQKYSKKYNFETAHIMAQIEAESSFNPKAHSGANAYGLMQLVPKSGGGDAYRFITNNSSQPTAEYLYDPEKNIELGCAYLHILRTKYFSNLDDVAKIRHCIIAAYNTGPGNVAKAFIGKNNVKNALPEIKKRSADEIYEFLLINLPYEETRKYLKKITLNIKNYQSNN